MKLFKPILFQGSKKYYSKKPYFEGWYYKFVSSNLQSLAVIPGVSLSKTDSLAFIQTINGSDGSTSYTRFSIDEFKFENDPFCVTIGEHRFSLNEISFKDDFILAGSVSIQNPRLYPVSLSRPGIMGWYRYLPFMECYHAVVSTNNSINGELILKEGSKDTIFNFSGGKGYIEKDWGTAFPSSYIWIQSNQFPEEENSFMLSVARIPWFGSHFRGFLGFFDFQGRIITFSTYTSAQITINDFSDRSLTITITGRGYGRQNSLMQGEKLIIKAQHKEVGTLMAPISGTMGRRISESIDASIQVTYFKNGKCLYEGESFCSGLEIVGDIEALL